MRIGQVAERCGISPSKIRFYETRGLLPSPQRLSNGYRDYSLAAVATLHFIKQAQALQFSLREIAAALPLHHETGMETNEVIPALERKLADIEANISTARILQRRLRALIAEQRACTDGEMTVKA